MNTILIVDDEASVRKTLSDILVYYGYSILAVDCGQKAINLIKEEIPDLVLLDIMLEDMSGIEVLREIKKEEEYTEFIILTGDISQESVVEAINLGAYGYIQKPYDIEQLLIMVKRAFEKQKTSKKLLESEKRYRTLFDSVNDAIFIYNLEGIFLEVNHIACERLGYSREEFLHMTISDINIKDNSLNLEEIISLLHEKGQLYFETIHVKRNGTVIPTEVNCRIIDYKDKKAILSSARDITQRKETEHLLIEEKERTEKARKELEIAYNDLKSAQSRILQSEKMASIGQLAAGVAHEINNPIGFIGGNLRSLEKYINKLLEFMEAQANVIKEFNTNPSIEKLYGKKKQLKINYITEDIKELIKESLDGTERVAKIVQDLKSFSRIDLGTDTKHININEVIERAL
ncbi:MAG: response regulator, partial [Candidatus Eremiobacterota bacterium]